MPVLVALPLGVSLGATFAWVARRDLRRAAGREGISLGLMVAALFGFLVFTPTCAYFLAFEPDWCLAYLVDTATASPALVPGLLVLELASVPAGFALAARVLQRTDERGLLRLLGGAALLSLGAIMLGMRRFAVQGSFAQFHGDFGTHSLAGSSLGYAILLLGFWLAVGAAFALWNLRRLD